MEKDFTVAWKSPANIALIKYWGKHGNQLPNNPSMSITLSNCVTQTSVRFESMQEHGHPEVHFQFHGKINPEFKRRIVQYIFKLREIMPFLLQCDLHINSSNNFPHSSGISSSASFMSSLALCLCSAEAKIDKLVDYNFLQRASDIARLGSGSAARSVFGGFVSWGKCRTIENSTDKYGSEINDRIHNVFKNYNDAILVISSSKKNISSSGGHQLMETNPYNTSRYTEAQKNHETMLKYLETGDENGFIKLVEHEALTLHAMLQTSDPWQILLEPNTIAILKKIRDFRNDTNLPVCFTIDAGPNIHLLYNNKYVDQVKEFINRDLKKFCENGFWIDDTIGQGPEMIEKII